MNPIYSEYYVHEKAMCYKIDLPYTNFKKDTVVLCKVSDGIELAREEARIELVKHIIQSLHRGEGVAFLYMIATGAASLLVWAFYTCWLEEK